MKNKRALHEAVARRERSWPKMTTIYGENSLYQIVNEPAVNCVLTIAARALRLPCTTAMR